MDDLEPTVDSVKQKLREELDAVEFRTYLGLLQEWFGGRLTKDSLDFNICTIFGDKCLELHNQLLDTILRVSSVVTHTASSTSSSNASQHCSSSSNEASSGGETGDDRTPPGSNDDANKYIIPPVPGEEPFVYPPDAQEYIEPVDPRSTWAVDMMDEDIPPPPSRSQLDYLYEAAVTCPANEGNVKPPNFKNRFPPWFADEFQRVHREHYSRVNIVENVTHFKAEMKEILERRPHLKQHFVIPSDEKVNYMTSGCSLYGRLLIKAWEHNIQNVHQSVTEYAVNVVKRHLKHVITAITKQRRTFRMKEKKVVHSVGMPYANPYLRHEFHLYDEPYGSDTTKMADVVLQVPTPFPSIEEKERMAALQVASMHPEKNSKYVTCKGTMFDFLLAIEEDPSIIPNNRSRHRMTETILRCTKGFGGSQNERFLPPQEQEEDDEQQSSSLLPVSSY